ncbi:MAG: citrate/2-methylcitrate synthase [Clostridiaceae bacterium]|nr:citrate/2-methylcitrate synthase [Clostridiaceae bacterium]
MEGIKKRKSSLMKEYALMAEKCNRIDPELYIKYDVKRGLRDISGKGVLAGLTEIGEVNASYVNEKGETVPGPGELIYRGMNIKDIVNGFMSEGRFGFEEVTYLLLFGELPDINELNEFKSLLSEYRKLPPSFTEDAVMKLPSRDVMNILSRSILALYTYDEQADDISISNVIRQCLQLIAQIPLLAVYGYQVLAHYYQNKSLVIHAPKRRYSTAENILHLLRPDSRFSHLEAVLLDLALVLHAEHGGGNNSTFATHVITSTGTDTYSAIASSICSLKGPRHGGANVKVTQMFDDLKRNVNDWEDEGQIRDYLNRLLNGEAFDRSGLIYGVGHAVYSVSDPRAEILKEYARELAKEKGYEDEFRLYEKVERLAPEVIAEKRKIYKGVSINVDFYSGFVYKALNIPEELFTPLFAVARIVGWSAHRIEELVNKGKIIRPAYKSIAPRREYVPLSMRSLNVDSMAGNL